MLLSTEPTAGFDPGPIDRVSNVSGDGGPTDVTDHSVLAELGLIDKYGRLSRDVNPVGGQGEPRAEVGEPGYPTFVGWWVPGPGAHRRFGQFCVAQCGRAQCG